MMLLNLLKKLGIKKFAIAGFDGYSKKKENYYDDFSFQSERFESKFDDMTINMRKMLNNYALSLDKKDDIVFLTPSIYSDIFKDYKE